MKRALVGFVVATGMALVGAAPAPSADESLHPLSLALELSARIPDRDLRITERVRIALVYWEVEQPYLAKGVLSKAIDDALSAPGPVEKGRGLFRIVGLLQKDQPEMALTILNVAQAEGAGEWPDSANTTLSVAGRLLALGEEERALALAATAGPERFGRWQAEAFAKFLHKEGDTERALAMQEVGLAAWRDHADMAKDWNHPLQVLREFAERFLEFGDQARAGEMLLEAAGKMDPPPPLDHRVRYLSRLSVQATRAGRAGLAEVFLGAAMAAMPEGEEGSYSHQREIASALAAQGRVDKAVGRALAIDGPLNAQDLTMSAVVKALVEAGLMAEAEAVALGAESDTARSWALNALGQGWLERGEPWQALGYFAQVPTRAGVRGQEGLLRHWRAEGNLEGLRAFISQAPIPDIRVRAVHYAAMAIDDRGATMEDLPLLTELLGVVRDGEEQTNFDSLWKMYPLATLARQFHAVGRQEEALESLRLADEALMRYTAPCDVSLYPAHMEAEKEARLEVCRQASLNDPMLDHRNRAPNLAILAAAYAQIGEYGLALDVTRRTGSITEAWLDTSNNVYPILSALRRVGEAYLQNGDEPTPGELAILEQLRSQAIGEPDWRLDPLGAAIAETGSIEDTTVRAEERGRMIQALEHAGFLAAAEAVLNLAIEEAVELGSGEERGKALGKLAAALWRIGGDERAQPLWDLALEHGGNEWLTPEVRAGLVGRRALRNNTPELVSEAFAGLDPHHLAVFRATEEFEWRRDRGEVEVARELLDEGVAAWRQYREDDTAKGWPLGYAEGYLEVGAKDAALAIAREAGEFVVAQELDYFTLREVRGWAVLAHRAGDSALAGRLLAAHHEYILAAPERLETRWWVRRGFQNWWRRAIGIDVTAPYRDIGYGDLAVTYFKTGREDEGRMTLAMIRGPDAIRDAYVDVAMALAKLGEEDTALGLVEGVGDGPARQGVLSGVASVRFDIGDTEGAWELWRQVWHEHGSMGQDRLLRHWLDEGAVDRLVEFVDQTPQGHLKMWGVDRAAMAMRTRGPTAEDKETLEWLEESLMEASHSDEHDYSLKARALEEVARAWHSLGEQERARKAMEEAELILEDLALPCPQDSLLGPPTNSAPEYCQGMSRHTDFYSGSLAMQANEWTYGAIGWARIGEFDRAVAIMERTGLGEDVVPTKASFRRVALRAIGIAMLEQGVAPPGALAGLAEGSG